MDGTGGGREEEVETPDPWSCSNWNQASLDCTGGGREEEAGTPNSHTCSSNNRVSMDGTGDGKSKPSHVWPTMPDESPNFVTPKILCDLHLLRILAEGRETSFLSNRGEETSLAFVSLALTGPFWISETPEASEGGLVSSPSPYPWPFHSLNLSYSHSRDFGNIWRVRNLKNSRVCK